MYDTRPAESAHPVGFSRLLATLVVVVATAVVGLPAAAAPDDAATTDPVDTAVEMSDGAGEQATRGAALTDGPTVDHDTILDATSGLEVSGPTAAPATAEERTTSSADVSGDVRQAVSSDGQADVIIRWADQVDPTSLRRQADAAAAAAGMAALERAGAASAGDVGADTADAASRAARRARASAVVDHLRTTTNRGREQAATVLQRAGVEPGPDLWVIQGTAATVDAEALDVLAASDAIASISLDEAIELPDPVTETPPKLPTWGLEKVNAPTTWGDLGIEGDGVVVGIMDSGVDGSHPALADKWRGADGGDVDKSWFSATGEPYPAPGDGHGHGTHVTGTVLGGPPGEVIGVAPGATWIAAKIFRDSGSTSTSTIHASFQWMLAPGGDPAAAPALVNNSWGNPNGAITEFLPDVQAWEAAGIVPIFAAGNDGPGSATVGSPGSFRESLTVGATDSDDVVAFFSSRGPATWDGEQVTKPDLSAPGHRVLSSLPTQLEDPPYGTLSGTSMATPHVSGVTALMLSSAPELGVDQVRDILTDTARVEQHMGATPDNAYGHGIVDARAAVLSASRSGTVTGTVSGPEGPVEATLTVLDPDGLEAATTSDATSGAYRLTVREGTRTVEVRAAGLVPETFEVEVSRDTTTVVDVDLEDAPDSSLQGVVSGPDGPLAGAAVRAGDEVAWTGVDGGYAIDLPADRHEVDVRAAGYEPVARTVDVLGATRLDVTLEVLPAGVGDQHWDMHLGDVARSGAGDEVVAPPTLQRAWQVDLAGESLFSSPTIAEGRVFATTVDGRLLAVDLDTGDRLWSYPLSPNARSTPTVVDDVVYVGGGDDGLLHAVDAATGDREWVYDADDGRTSYATAAVVDGRAIFTTGLGVDDGGTMHAVEVATGTADWVVEVGANAFFGPSVTDGLAVATSLDAQQLTAVDVATGEVAWRHVSDDDETFLGAPSAADGHVYVIASDLDLATGTMMALDAATGEVEWEAAHGDGQLNTPVISGGVLVAGTHTSGLVAAYDRATGDRLWRVSAGPAVTASTAVTADGYVLLGTQLDDEVLAVDVATGEVVWRDTVTDSVLATPAADAGHVVALDANATLTAWTPTGTVAGVVSGPDGPIEGATLEVVGTTATTATGDDGGYEVAVRPGEWTVRVTAWGYGQATLDVTVSPGRTIARDVTLDPVGTGTLSGTVTGEDGAPVQGATVVLPDTPLGPVTTDDDGTYTFAGVSAGTWDVEVTAEGWVPQDDEVDVAADTTTTLDVVLSRYDAAIINDFVGLDHERGQWAIVLEQEGLAIDEVTLAEATAQPEAYGAIIANFGTGSSDFPTRDEAVALRDAAAAAGTSIIWTDSWGQYWGGVDVLRTHFGDPASTRYDFNDGDVSFEATADHPLTASLSVGEEVPVVRSGSGWASHQGWSGRTLATLSTTGSGTTGGAIGLRINSMDTADVLLSLGSDAFMEPAEGEVLGTGIDVMLDAIGWASDATFGSVTGMVADGGGNGLANASVTVVDTGQRFEVGADGAFEAFVEPGQHTLEFAAPGFVPATRDVTVAAGEVVHVDVSLVDSGLGEATGVVTSAADGEVVPDATVTVVGGGPDGGDATATTDADGRWTLGLPGGTHPVEVSADGFRTTTTEVTVVAGESTTLDVELEPSARVVVVDDYQDQVTALLEAREVDVTTVDGIEDIDLDAGLDDVDVVYWNDQSFPYPTPDEIRAVVDATDAAGVSIVFPDGYYSSNGSVRFLRDAYSDPTEGEGFRSEGEIRYVPTDPDHPLFAGTSEAEPVIVRTGGEATTIGDYTGFPLADIATAEAGVKGAGAAWTPRTAESIHLLLGGMDHSVLQQAEDYWTDDAATVLVNALQFAAAPRLGAVEGVVRGAGGDPLDATIEVQGTSLATTTAGDGTFELGLPAGDWTLDVSSFGHAAQSHDVTVTANQVANLDVDLAAGASGTLSGVVTSLGGVGVPGSAAGTAPSVEGTPLEGATVRLLGAPRQATTDADGRWELSLVEPGDYELEVVADGHLRTRVPVTVEVDTTTSADVALPGSPTVGVVDDHEGRMVAYLDWWGYDAADLAFDDLEAVAAQDLVVANFGNFPRLDPTAEGLAAFRDAADRAGVDVVWLDAYQRGSLRWLNEYEDDPAAWDEDRNDGAVTATLVSDQSGHPILAGLPDTFDVVEPDGEYTWFDEAEATTLATVQSAEAGGGDLVAVRGRTADGVEVLLGSIAANFYGHPGYDDVPGELYTPEAERLLRNAVRWAALAPSGAGEARVTLADEAGSPLAGTVTVVETGRQAATRAIDGTAVVGLQPGTWTLRGDAFGHVAAEASVEITAGTTTEVDITLPDAGAATISGRISDDEDLPIAGASVIVDGTELAATTDSDGRYTVDGLPPGDWTVRFAADGYVTTARAVSVAAGDTVTLDLVMEPSSAVGIWGDPYGDLEVLLDANGYDATDYDNAGSTIADLTADLDQYGVIVVNDDTFSTYEPDWVELVTTARDRGVSIIFMGQFFGYGVGELSDQFGDPEAVDDGFVPDGITLTATAEHPLTAGLPVGEAVPLVADPGSNQQYLTYSGYSGTTVGTLAAQVDGTPLGDTVGYRHSGPTSVEVLLSSLGVGSYGNPGDEWTEHAETLFLNAVSFAGLAELGGVRGTVTDGEGAPIPGVTVTAVEPGLSTTTASDGRYGLDLPDGDHTIRFEALGYETAEESVTIADAAITTLDVSLASVPRRQLTGTVTSTEGGPVAGAEVVVDGPVDATTTTDADGHYVVDGLLPGDHEVTVTATGYIDATRSVTVPGDDAVLDVELEPIDVGVLGDVDATLTTWLGDNDVAAAELSWDGVEDLGQLDTVVVNGPGDADVGRAEVDALLAAAEQAESSLVWLGTWGVNEGGVRLLEAHGDRDVTVTAQGYGDGDVLLADPVTHPLVADVAAGDEVIATDGYWSLLGDWVGHEVARATVDVDPDGDGGEPATTQRGLLAGYDWRTAGGVDVVLSVGAVTGASGPDHGWAPGTGELVHDAVTWATEAELAPPSTPTLQLDSETPTTGDTAQLSGTAAFREVVEIQRDGEVVATVAPGRDGTFAGTVDLVEGVNVFTATATNPAGTSPPSDPVEVVRDTTAPVVDWTSPIADLATAADVTEVTGTIQDVTAVALQVNGTDVAVADDGSFATTIDLAVGENPVTLVATDEVGHDTTLERTVLRLDATVEYRLAGGRGPAPTNVFVEVDGPDAEWILGMGEPTLVATDDDGEVVGTWSARAQVDDLQFMSQVRDLDQRWHLVLHGDLEGWQVRLPRGP